MDLNTAISQLEEPKLIRLLKHLADEDCARDPERVQSAPVDIACGGVHAKLYTKISSVRSYSTLWFFQIVHIPEFLWSGEASNELIQKRLREAFSALREQPGLRAIMEGGGELQSLFPTKIPDWYPTSVPREYYVLTNYLCDLSQENLKFFYQYSQELYRQMVGTIRHDDLSFGIGTPDTMISGARERVHSFVVDLLNSPSSYYIVARAGTLEVAAVTEHGGFMASSSDRDQTGLSLIATSTLTGYAARGLSDLNQLINDPRAKERDFQELFVQYPELLMSLRDEYCEVRPHVCLFDTAGDRLVPDWMARIQDSNVWDIIELKKPQHPLMRTRGSSARLSAVVARGISELLTYRDFFGVRANRRRFAERYGTSPYEPGLVLVVGKGQPGHRYEWAATHAGYSRVQVVSYDYVLERARQRSEALRCEPTAQGKN